MKFLIVGVGSAVGGILRYLVSLIATGRTSSFPWWTLSVNVVGGFLIGMFGLLLAERFPAWRLLLITGLCGGFTTFSAFSLEVVELFQQGAWKTGLVTIVLNVTGSLLACIAGIAVGTELAR